MEPAVTVWLFGKGVMVKSGCGGPLLKVAAWTVSGAGYGVPFATSTHVVVPETLDGLQPVWKARLVPEVVPVML